MQGFRRGTFVFVDEKKHLQIDKQREHIHRAQDAPMDSFLHPSSIHNPFLGAPIASPPSEHTLQSQPHRLAPDTLCLLSPGTADPPPGPSLWQHPTKHDSGEMLILNAVITTQPRLQIFKIKTDKKVKISLPQLSMQSLGGINHQQKTKATCRETVQT